MEDQPERHRWTIAGLRGARDATLARYVPDQLISYPMEFLLSFWCPLSGIGVLLGAPSPTLNNLPRPVLIWWAILATAAGFIIAFGLWKRLYGTVMTRGLYLLAAVVLAFGVTGLSNFSVRGFIGPTLLCIIGIVLWIRAWSLRKDEEALVREMHRVNGNGGDDAHAPGDE